MDVDRRELLRQLGMLVSGIGAAAALDACDRNKGAGPSTGAPAPADASIGGGDGSAAAGEPEGAGGIQHALSAFQRETLEAACARILPADHQPGAREANVIEYIDRELARPEYELLKSNVLQGVVALSNISKRTTGKLFTQLDEALQDDILRQVQALGEQGLDFIRILVILTVEGFFGDPKYGGNKGGVGWRMIGYGPGNPDGSGTGGHVHH